MEAVDLIARHGWALLEDYRFDIATGLWKHRAGPVEPPLRLADVHYDDVRGAHQPAARRSCRRGRTGRAPGGGPRAAGRGSRPGRTAQRPQLPDELGHLQWFDLPAASLALIAPHRAAADADAQAAAQRVVIVNSRTARQAVRPSSWS